MNTGRYAAVAVGAVAITGLLAASPASAAGSSGSKAAPKQLTLSLVTIDEPKKDVNTKSGFIGYSRVADHKGHWLGSSVLRCTFTSADAAHCTVAFYLKQGTLTGTANINSTPAATGFVSKGTGAYAGYTGPAYALTVSDSVTDVVLGLHKH
jgi:hypothetical protein